MSDVLIQDREFTYKRLSSTGGEVVETVLAHFATIHPTGDNLFTFTFYNYTEDGHGYVVKSVSGVLEECDNRIVPSNES